MSTDFGDRCPEVVEDSEYGFKNSVVVIRALNMKHVEDGHMAFTTNNWKQLFKNTHTKKISSGRLRVGVATFSSKLQKIGEEKKLDTVWAQ